MKYQIMFSIVFLLISPSSSYCPQYPIYSVTKSVTISRSKITKTG